MLALHIQIVTLAAKKRAIGVMLAVILQEAAKHSLFAASVAGHFANFFLLQACQKCVEVRKKRHKIFSELS